MKYEYLLFDLFIFFCSTVGASIYKKGILPKIQEASIAITSIALPYIIWDLAVVNTWWFFEEKYTLGIEFGQLPIEELLFFFVVPWSCLIIWVNLQPKVLGQLQNSSTKYITFLAFLVGVYSFVEGRLYSAIVSLLVFLTVSFDAKKLQWLQKKAAWGYLAIVVTLTVIFNTYLTARPIVTYEPEFISNIRVITVPIEDIFYGLILIGSTTALYEFLVKKSTKG